MIFFDGASDRDRGGGTAVGKGEPTSLGSLIGVDMTYPELDPRKVEHSQLGFHSVVSLALFVFDL
jgi:hypothetical protein